MHDTVCNESGKVPDLHRCLMMMRRMAMPEHIAAHSIRVAQVAELIAGHLMPALDKKSLPRVRAGALLHDITKARSFATGEMHSQTGQVWAIRNGYGSIAPIVGQHVRLDHFDFEASITPEEIVNYADKRVLHDRVVRLDRRLTYIKKRYGGNPEANARISTMQIQAARLEEKLFSCLPFNPEDVSQQVSDHRFHRWMRRYTRTDVTGNAMPPTLPVE